MKKMKKQRVRWEGRMFLEDNGSVRIGFRSDGAILWKDFRLDGKKSKMFDYKNS